MIEDDLLADLWEDQRKGLLVFPTIEKQLYLSQLNKEAREFRSFFYPSSLEWGMCIKEHLDSLLQNKSNFVFTPTSESKKLVGTALHEIWQKILLDSRLLYGKPNYPDEIKEELKTKKNKKNYPEIYCKVPEWAISCWIDCIIRDNKVPVVNDFKTKNIKIEDWEDSKKEFPSDKEQTQVYIYACCVDKLNYYPEKIAGIRLSYFNVYAVGFPKYKGEIIDPRYEWNESIDPIKYQKTLDLLQECGKQMRDHRQILEEDIGKGYDPKAKLSESQIKASIELRSCTYNHCKIHSLGVL